METLPIKPRILIVDDHPANLLAFELVLEEDFSPFLAESGKEALELSERSEFAVILLDIRMPIMDGYEIAIELRRRENTRETPIIFTSAIEKTPAGVLQDVPLGATDYLFTPVDPRFLRFKVATYAQMHLRNRSLRFHLDRIAENMRTLRAGIPKSSPMDSALDDQILELERISETLKRRPEALENSRA